MRNIFDQYSQPENRLTHALVVALAEDRWLLNRFVRWVTGVSALRGSSLEIVEQGLPGDAPIAEEDSERRGLPDAWIYQGDRWALLIESKVAATLRNEQLLRHHRTASRRGFRQITLLVIDVASPARPLPEGSVFREWSDVYAWLIKQSGKSEWAQRAAEYFVAAENRLVGEGYLKEGTLTTFAGIPFRAGEPYNYPEAKRLLKLAMDELRKRKDLVKILGMDPVLPGRGSITGKDGVAVWDFLRLRISRHSEVFTKYPHLTIAIQGERVLAIVTVPHGIQSQLRRNLIELGFDGFQEVLSDVNKKLLRALRKAKGAAPWVDVVQRRYATQRSAAFVDARIEFDLRTAFPESKKGSKVKPQPEWLKASYDALCKKKSNLQFAVGASFPYQACPSTNTRKIIDHVSDVWVACKPLIDAMLGKQNPHTEKVDTSTQRRYPIME